MQKLVLFDVDSTLLKAPPANLPASAVMFKKVYGIDAHEEMIENHGKTEKGIIKEVLQKIIPDKNITGISDEAHDAWAQAAQEGLEKHPATVLPEVLDLLRGLADHNLPYALLTGNSYPRTEVKLVSAKLDSFFRDKEGKIRGAFGDMSYDRMDLIEIAKKQMGLTESMAILIDDSLGVAKLVAKLNIPAVFVATGKRSVEELKQYVPHVVPTFANGGWREVLRIIQEEY